MWILSQSGTVILNSNQVRSLGVNGDYLIADGNIYIGEFSTQDEAKKELSQIYAALVSGQESYSVG